jgi:AraC family transcriptional regulator
LGNKTKGMQSIYTFILKGMVCERCISVIRQELEGIGIVPIRIELGEVTIVSTSLWEESKLIEEKLKPLGFKLLEDRKAKLVQDIKDLVAEVYSGEFDFPLQFRFSDLITNRLKKEYDSASYLFSIMEKKTLERYIIDYRIDRVKWFLSNSNESLSSIAFKLNFSSVAHLSKQFKQYTGMNTTLYRELMQPLADLEFSEN